MKEKTGAWYNMYIVSLFIEEITMSRKKQVIRKSQPSIAVFLWTMAAITRV